MKGVFGTCENGVQERVYESGEVSLTFHGPAVSLIAKVTTIALGGAYGYPPVPPPA